MWSQLVSDTVQSIVSSICNSVSFCCLFKVLSNPNHKIRNQRHVLEYLCVQIFSRNRYSPQGIVSE